MTNVTLQLKDIKNSVYDDTKMIKKNVIFQNCTNYFFKNLERLREIAHKYENSQAHTCLQNNELSRNAR